MTGVPVTGSIADTPNNLLNLLTPKEAAALIVGLRKDLAEARARTKVIEWRIGNIWRAFRTENTIKKLAPQFGKELVGNHTEEMEREIENAISEAVEDCRY